MEEKEKAMATLISSRTLLLSLFFSTLISSFPTTATAVDSIRTGESIDDTDEIVSAKDKFVLGFFSEPQGSNSQYLGIWYQNIPKTVVWVANRDNPIITSSAHLNCCREGNLVLLNQSGGIVWSSNSTRTVKKPVAQLLDTGNLVLRDSGSDDILWQSFDYPFDTLLPTMQLGWDSKTGLNRKLTSRRSPNDPSSGEYIYSVSRDGLPQYVVRKGSKVAFRSGGWFGERFIDGYPLKGTDDYLPKFIFNSREALFSYTDLNNTLSRVVLDFSGFVYKYFWRDEKWHTSFIFDGAGCNDYGLCGNFGVCSFTITANCGCLPGFEQKPPNNTSNRCVRKDPICKSGDGFVAIRGVKWPDSSGKFVKVKTNVQDCRAECLKDCFCSAYGIVEIPETGRGCVLWSQHLTDTSLVPSQGEELYVRVAASELESSNRKSVVAVVVPVTISAVIIGVLLSWFITRRVKRAGGDAEAAAREAAPTKENEMEMPLFDIATIEAATHSFAISNKIGEGGFGPVYKGTLSSGQEIAVKKLAETSGQGLQEFKNEVLLISQLQHRNLVRLLGFCIHKEETLLVYEYMPNKSLDYFLFGDERRYFLDWQKRSDIIIGIARGLLYLHRDSRLRIVHRDLKPANILLDSEMKPKISDFGMARMFGENQMATKTKRVVGTYGYMSPEYLIDGYFSFKSDVFSFGVVLLEVISGKKNNNFFHPDHQLNLLGHVWKLWNEGRASEIIEVKLEGQYEESEALRYIHIGLLCVQRRSEERPSMSSVVAMLESDTVDLTVFGAPGFYGERFLSEMHSSLRDQLMSIPNDVTISLLHGR